MIPNSNRPAGRARASSARDRTGFPFCRVKAQRGILAKEVRREPTMPTTMAIRVNQPRRHSKGAQCHAENHNRRSAVKETGGEAPPSPA